MKFDVTDLPLGEALIGFVLMAVVGGFVLAFAYGPGGFARDEFVAPPPETPEGSPTPGETPPPDETPTDGDGENLIVMGDNFFDFQGDVPPTITVPAGEEVTFQLVNEGQALHNMHIAGPDGEYGAPFCQMGGEEPCSDPDVFNPSDEGTITFSLDQPGEAPFRCDFHPVEMVGTIVVE